MREEMQNKRVEGSSGNGLVTITLDGEKSMRAIHIKPECVDPNDLEGLQDLILAAYEDAAAKISDSDADPTSSMLSGTSFGL